jgi:3-oxosteroid 1-dehydrogenase
MARLASQIGVPPTTLEESVERFNAQVDDGVDEFGRGTYIWDGFSSRHLPARKLEEGPYYALQVLPGCAGTKGGPVIDRHARVRRRGGDGVVTGLYAAGNVAAYPFGEGYPGPGAIVGPGFVFGWIAGETAAAA